VNLHEYQAKEILGRFAVPVPAGVLAQTPEAARAAAASLGGTVVVKAQIHAGGRGKGGGIKLAKSPQEAFEIASKILGMTLVTPQTGPKGRLVRKVYVTRAVEIAKEYYLSLLVDRARARLIVMASREGGVEIEKVAAEHPERIVIAEIDPIAGYQPYLGRKIAYGLGLGPVQSKSLVAILARLVEAFLAIDASLIEINPMIETPAGELIALDAKLGLDDNALMRHPDLAAMRDEGEEEPLEVAASRAGLNYVKLDGSVACMVNGAGLAMATMDIIDLCGARPANFLDVGGGAKKETVAAAFQILLQDPDVRAVLVNIFGGIVRCDRVAEGIVAAAKEVDLKIPLVVRLQGTNAEQARKLLEQSGLTLKAATALDEAANLVVSALQGDSR
jgi:succinyl-CoA synthetase beta subunit